MSNNNKNNNTIYNSPLDGINNNDNVANRQQHVHQNPNHNEQTAFVLGDDVVSDKDNKSQCNEIVVTPNSPNVSSSSESSPVIQNNQIAIVPQSQQQSAEQQQQQQQQQAPPRPIPYVGLINPSCICYLNSLIQCLYHTPAFRSAVFKVNTEKDDLDDTPKALQNLFYSLGNAIEGEAQTTKLLTESFGWGSSELSIQHDIQELFVKLRESVESRLEGSVDILFSGLGENYIRCLDDSYTSRKSEYFHDLILPVQNHPNLDHTLDGYCAVDRLDGSNKYKVELPGRAPEFKDAEKGYRFLRFAPVVFVHLKRFEMDFTSPNLDMKKINSCFEFPKTLDLSQRENGIFVTQDHVNSALTDPNLKKAFEIGIQQQRLFPEVYGDDATDPTAIYELYAVLVHSGGVHHGHYTCNIRDVEMTGGVGENHEGGEASLANRWYNYDDHVVSEISESNAVDRNYGGYTLVRGQQYLSSKNAYMLAYVRKPLVRRLFRNDDRGGLKTLLPTVQEEFGAKIREQLRQQRIEAEKNRQCHITLIDDSVIAESVRNRQVELLENGDSISKSAPLFAIPKATTIKDLYAAAAQVLKKPVTEFKLHWYLPTASYDTKFRVNTVIEYNDDDLTESDDDEDAKQQEQQQPQPQPEQTNGTNKEGTTAAADASDNGGSSKTKKAKGPVTIESIAPNNLRLPDRPWSFKLYVEHKVIQPAPVLTNCARYAKFIVTSNQDGLSAITGDNKMPAIPFCDNRMFSFDQTDRKPQVQILLDKVYSIEAIAFQCPLPKTHPAQYGCTRYDVRIMIYDDDRLVHTHTVEHRGHTDHYVLHSDNRFVGVEGRTGPYRGNKVVMERVNVSVYDHYVPHSRIDVSEADAWIISRLKIQCTPGETGRESSELYTQPRFITDDWRCNYVAVKYYSYRTCRLDFCGYVALSITEFMETTFPILRYVCRVDANTKIRLYAETDGVAEPIDAYRKCWSPKKRDEIMIDPILIVQEEPPISTQFIYEMPFVSSYLRTFAGTRNVMLFSFKAPEEGGQAIVSVPDYATHDMVCEEVGKALNVPWDRIRLYGCRDSGYGSNHANLPPLPRPEPFRSAEVNGIRGMLDGRREGILFYDVLKCSLKDAESVMEIKCHYSDALGNRISSEPFCQEVSVSVSLLDLAELLLEHFGFPFESCHAFLDISDNMIENFALVNPQAAERRGVTPALISGCESSNACRVQNKTPIMQFFRSFESREFELRPFPEANIHSQVYVCCHGEFYSNGFPPVVMSKTRPPAFIPMPTSADVNDAIAIIREKYGMKEEDFHDEPEHHGLMLYIHSTLHFPNWETKLKDYFFHNPSQLQRPKALLINHKHDAKAKPGSRYVPQNQPQLSLKKKDTKDTNVVASPATNPTK